VARRPRPRQLADLDEAAIIERLQRAFLHVVPKRAPRLGIGDDAAVLSLRAGHQLVATTDAAVEGADFLRDRFPPRAVGHRVLAQNLSDLAAMGATPIGFLLTLCAAPETALTWVDAVARGMAALAAAARCPLVGGDLSATSGPVTISITALGEIARGRALTRAGARPGDQVWVSGELGGAALGLEWLLAARSGARVAARGVLARLLRPEPRLALGRALRPLASACVDVSDGLVIDLERLALASGARLTIDASLLPVARGASTAQALGSGEELELVFTVPRARATAMRRAARRVGVAVCVIGEVGSGSGLIILHRPRARLARFDHFARR